tara:strand:+ start:294 stop:947 length:654 start_codon:yes stop_codon:yes gene_type:complete
MTTTQDLVTFINAGLKRDLNNQEKTFLKTLGYKKEKGKLVWTTERLDATEENPEGIAKVTGDLIISISDKCSMKNWSDKKVAAYDKENGTCYSKLLNFITDKTERNTTRSLYRWFAENYNEAMVVLFERHDANKKTTSLESLKKHTISAIKKLEKETSETSETAETEETAEIVKPASEEEDAKAIILILKDAKKAGRDTKAILQMMGDMLKAEKLNK